MTLFDDTTDFNEENEWSEPNEPSRFSLENSLVALLTTTLHRGSDRQSFGPDKFEEMLGSEVAEFLRGAGCTDVTVNGNTVNLRFRDVYQQRVDQGVEQIRLQKNVSFNVERDGEKIRIKGITGVHVDPYYYPFWKSVPDITLERGRISMYRIVSFDADPALYDNVNEMMKRMGR